MREKVGKQLFHINVRNKDGKRACTGEEQKETLCKHLEQKKVNLRDPYLMNSTRNCRCT